MEKEIVKIEREKLSAMTGAIAKMSLAIMLGCNSDSDGVVDMSCDMFMDSMSAALEAAKEAIENVKELNEE